jgi:hypothetical protein
VRFLAISPPRSRPACRRRRREFVRRAHFPRFLVRLVEIASLAVLSAASRGDVRLTWRGRGRQCLLASICVDARQCRLSIAAIKEASGTRSSMRAKAFVPSRRDGDGRQAALPQKHVLYRPEEDSDRERCDWRTSDKPVSSMADDVNSAHRASRELHRSLSRSLRWTRHVSRSGAVARPVVKRRRRRRL